MKKISIFILILSLALAFTLTKKDEPIGTVIVNQAFFPEIAVRSQLKSCIEGQDGTFTQPIILTLYTDSENIPQYRALMSRLESWGADVILRKETAQNIFDFRALGELSLYIWTGEKDDIFEAFMSKNAVFYSTGYADDEYDEAVANGDFERANELIYSNISAIDT